MGQDGGRLSLIGENSQKEPGVTSDGANIQKDPSMCSNAVVADHLTPAAIEQRLVMVETSMADMGNKIDMLLDLVQKKNEIQPIN